MNNNASDYIDYHEIIECIVSALDAKDSCTAGHSQRVSDTALIICDLIGKENATMEEVIAAAKKASIHDFIMTLPKQYDTEVGELGDTLSGGEKQRIGIARAFLHDAPLMLLDEPTSNLDSLNEGIILKSLKNEAKGKTIVLVSHRKSTMNVADRIFDMKKERVS